MDDFELLTKTKMSELVGWSEATGRRWVKHFKEYLPTQVTGKSTVQFGIIKNYEFSKEYE
ncbi:hypothetical protein WQ54_31115 [Bacillus sp. SA1-12]|uniref:hypothetical protein n=1 Tax=Bacillus sp. SA1-12 TaxID=1455638 RepID=UPI0006271A77|nr:hypothetical protein [Bacillus sp. SA1-12]KKI88638.1 hypothetical protein WQ54_31115 [Bacillus sp. SA1-12]